MGKTVPEVTLGNIIIIIYIIIILNIIIGKNCARGLEYGPRPAASGRTRDTEGPIRTDQGR